MNHLWAFCSAKKGDKKSHPIFISSWNDGIERSIFHIWLKKKSFLLQGIQRKGISEVFSHVFTQASDHHLPELEYSQMFLIKKKKKKKKNKRKKIIIWIQLQLWEIKSSIQGLVDSLVMAVGTRTLPSPDYLSSKFLTTTYYSWTSAQAKVGAYYCTWFLEKWWKPCDTKLFSGKEWHLF